MEVENLFEMQAEFLKAAGTPMDLATSLVKPDGADFSAANMAARLITEEYREWEQEWEHLSAENVKEALDLLYVCLQYLNTLVGPEKAMKLFSLLHDNNMSKCVDGKLVKRPDGKVLKPKGYRKISSDDIENIVFG